MWQVFREAIHPPQFRLRSIQHDTSQGDQSILKILGVISEVPKYHPVIQYVRLYFEV